MRQVVLDTETTGLSPAQGHRIVEIGCVEIVNRKITGGNFQVYINPNRKMDPEASRITGIKDEFLVDKPLFEDVVDDFLDFVSGAELIIHNAPFDVGFLNHELSLMNHRWKTIDHKTTVFDTLALARKMYPGQRNSLDALCKRLNVSNSHRHVHGALLDSEILADVYIAMTAGQGSLLDDGKSDNSFSSTEFKVIKIDRANRRLPVIKASQDELFKHNALMQRFGD